MAERKPRGFENLSPEERRAAAVKGGSNVAPEKRAFSTKPGLASAAGKKGGTALKPENRSFSINRELAREAGRKGGLASQKRKEKKGETKVKRVLGDQVWIVSPYDRPNLQGEAGVARQEGEQRTDREEEKE